MWTRAISAAEIVLLVDCEFTCWEGSLDSGWSDPDFPAEIVEIGLIAYDLAKDSELARFSTLARPVINPKLSNYFLDVIPITQAEVDTAPDFSVAVSGLQEWLAEHAPQDSPTVGWGELDRAFIRENSIRSSVGDPFGTRRHIEMGELVKLFLGTDVTDRIDREQARFKLGIEEVSGRHRAIADAEDLITFANTIDLRASLQIDAGGPRSTDGSSN